MDFAVETPGLQQQNTNAGIQREDSLIAECSAVFISIFGRRALFLVLLRLLSVLGQPNEVLCGWHYEALT